MIKKLRAKLILACMFSLAVVLLVILASIAGGMLYLLLQQVWQGAGAILTSVVGVIVIRCAAAHFEWDLPRAKTVWKSDE